MIYAKGKQADREEQAARLIHTCTVRARQEAEIVNQTEKNSFN
jgi:hypothetical protein